MNKKLLLKKLISIISKNKIITDKKILESYNKDWRGFYNKKSICVILPSTNKEISNILNFCFINNIKIVPQGGNTSLTGASVPSKNNYEIILNLKKMNKILSIDKVNMLVEVESGVILDNLKKYTDLNDLYFPLNISSSGSCLIGGNIATNAGGINALKYGSIRESLQGIEVILADGTIINNMSSIKKNNTGYDIKNIFCGSEGTLGIITKALLKLYPKPFNYFHSLISFSSINQTILFYEKIKLIFNEKIESAEIIPDIAFEITIKHGFLKERFFKKKYDTYLLCKFALFEDKLKFEKFFIEKVSKIQNKFEDLIIPKSIQQENNFWKFRDDLVESYKKEGNYITNDISLPLNQLNIFIKKATKKIDKLIPGTRIYSFGHLGDGNIHFNMIEPLKFSKNFTLYRESIYELVNKLVKQHNGSFSAEHGIGMIKKTSFLKYKSLNEINFMKRIKKSIDPKNILNPGKIFNLK